MLKIFFAIAALIPFTAVAADNYGEYTNGKVNITYEIGPRGEDLFQSSVCKGNFSPLLDGKTEMFVDKKAGYAIYFLGEPIHMEIESTNKCFPEGRYRKKEMKKPSTTR
jgi:hypothetical protein